MELEGILLWAIVGLQRLVANDFRFSESDRIKANRRLVHRDANNLITFLESEGYIKLKEDASIGSVELYQIYSIWCEENGFTPLKARSVSDFLIANQAKYGLTHCNTLLNAAGRRVWGFHGIGPVLKLPMATCDGWQKVWPTEHPFSKPQQEKMPL